MPKEDLYAEIPRVRSLNHLVEKKKRWGVSAAALAYTLHKLGKITDWHYRSYCIALGKFGTNVEPSPIERESSQIWEKVLTDLWRRGMPIKVVAEKLNVPERELNSLLFGIASKQFSHDKKGDRQPLRVV